MALANLLIKIGADVSELQTKMATAVKTVDKTSSQIESAGSLIQKTFVSAFTVTAIIGFAKHVVDTASEIHDLSSALGISGEKLQRYTFAAEQSGATMDDVGRAINTMNKALAGGSTGTVQALRDASLSFETIRAMKPQDAFDAITEAVKTIPDPILQAKVAAELFGKSALALLPGIKEGFLEVGSAATVMSDQSITSLEKLGDRFGALKNRVVPILVELFNSGLNFLNVTEGIESAWNFVTRATTAAAKVPMPKMFTPAGSQDIHATDAELERATKTLDEQRRTLDQGAEKARQYAEAIRAIADRFSGASAIKTGAEALKAINLNLKAGITIAMMEAGQLTELNKTLGASLDAYARLGKTAPDELRKAYQATIHLTQDTLPAINTFKEALAHSADGLLQMLPIVREWPTHFAGLNAQIERLPSLFTKGELAAKSFDDHGLDDLARSFAQLATISGDAFGGIVQDIANVVASYDLATKAAKAYGDATTKAEKGAALLSGAAAIGQGTGSGSTGSRVLGGAAAGAAMGTAILPGWGTAIGAAAGALIGLYRGLKGLTDYQKRMQAAVAETYNLQTSLVAAHGSMERLVLDADLVGINIKEAFTWKDPQAFKNIVAELDAKTQLLNASMQEYGFTWEDLGEKARGAKLGQLFDDLFAKTQILKGAGIDYHEILLRQSHDYSDLVQAAIRTGTEIPAAMKPVLQDLIDMGTLVDENGQSFTDLGQLKFAETMTEGFHQVTDAIHELISALVDGVGPALDDIGRRVVRPRISPVFDDNGASATAGYAGGTHGQFVDFGAGTHVVLHGHERISTPGEGSGGGGDVHVFIGNAQLDSHLVRVARKDAAQGGLKPRARSGRSY